MRVPLDQLDQLHAKLWKAFCLNVVPKATVVQKIWKGYCTLAPFTQLLLWPRSTTLSLPSLSDLSGFYFRACVLISHKLAMGKGMRAAS